MILFLLIIIKMFINNIKKFKAINPNNTYPLF